MKKTSLPLKTIFVSALVAGLATASIAFAESQVSVSLDLKNPGAAIPPDFTGLSFEVAILLPDANGKHYFRPDNQPLLQLFRTLGIKNLRIGGNTSDRDVKQLPNNADFDSLFGFAKAANVKVVYCLRLHNGDPQVDAATVKYIMDHYAAQMDSFSIGQEPSAYPVEKADTRAQTERMGGANEKFTYAAYREEWKKFEAAIVAAVPNVKFCGPSVHNNGQWARDFMTDFGHGHHVTLITEHLYPGGAGGKVPTPEIGRDRMLSDNFVKAYEKLYDSFVPMAISNGLPYRLEEVNNYFNGGATNVSSTFAASLWGLDFMYWWASHSAAGLNFHTGDRVAAGYALQPSKYTAFFSTTNGYLVRPLGYGIKAFELGSHGRLVPVTLANSDNVNLSAYAVLGADKTLYLTLINKEHGAGAKDAMLMLDPGSTYKTGSVMLLLAPDNDAAATNHVTLGSAEIMNDASWAGKWVSLTAHENKELAPVRLKLPASSAAVVRLDSPVSKESTAPEPLR